MVACPYGFDIGHGRLMSIGGDLHHPTERPALLAPSRTRSAASITVLALDTICMVKGAALGRVGGCKLCPQRLVIARPDAAHRRMMRYHRVLQDGRRFGPAAISRRLRYPCAAAAIRGTADPTVMRATCLSPHL